MCEKKVKILDENKIRGKKVCILQSFSDPVDENIIETLLIADALERIGARSASIIIPWMGYSLQDKVFSPGEPISAKVVADVISNSFYKKSFSLRSTQFQYSWIFSQFQLIIFLLTNSSSII